MNISRWINKISHNKIRLWEKTECPKWVDYEKLNYGNPDLPGDTFTKYFKGDTYLYKYVTYRGFENHGHGSDSWEKYYRKKRK